MRDFYVIKFENFNVCFEGLPETSEETSEETSGDFAAY